jgi:Alpha-glutamyl/putrescinyl thymine pyrophosphorylase clade 3
MRWPKKQARRQQIADALEEFSQTVMPLPGMAGPAERDALSMQIVASLRREEYFRLIQRRGPIPASRADPAHPAFEGKRSRAALWITP